MGSRTALPKPPLGAFWSNYSGNRFTDQVFEAGFGT
jgi:hypothetical protein